MLRRWCLSIAVITAAAGASMAAPLASGSVAAGAPATTVARTVIAHTAVTHSTVTHSTIRQGGTAVHVTTTRTSGSTPLSKTGGIAHEESSTNWSGYAADSGTYSSVSAEWVQPTGHCSGENGDYSSFWVGLDGYSSSTVEQTGTDTDCINGSPQYYGWYETYPNPSYSFGSTVSPGDTMKATVTYESGSSFLYTLQDVTKGWTANTTQSESGAARSSAEVIVEAPCCTNSGGILPLADFGTVNFSNSLVNGSAIGNTNPAEIIMIDNSGRDKDTISSLSGGENWSATWVRAN
jgi:peptidase A4-like protein